MRDLLEIVLSNAAIATFLAPLAMIVGRYCRRPTVVYGCWFLVLLKLATPSLVRVPVSFIVLEPIAEPNIEAPQKMAGQLESHIVGSSVAIEPDSVANLAPPDEMIRSSPAERRSDDTASPWGKQLFIPTPIASDRPLTEEAVSGGPSRSDRDRKSETVAAPALIQSAYRRFAWGELALGVWGLGSIIYLSVVAWRLVRFSREIRRVWPQEDDLQRQADILARRFGLSQSPVVKLVDAPVPPMLWAMRRPATILLPRALVARLSPRQKNTLLAHELAHFCRHDHWVRWFEVIILGAYWWHPVAWIARRELQRAEEQCCDAWVVWALPDAGREYARAILETVDFLTADCRPAPALASGLGPVHHLERRFEMILHARPTRRLSGFAKSALMLLGLVVLPLSARAQALSEPVQPAPASKPEAQIPPAQPRAEAAQTTTTERSVELTSPSPGTPLTTPPTVRETQGVVATSSGTTDADAQNRIENRLSRLEKMMDRILSEVRDQPASKLDSARSNGGASYMPGRYESGMMSSMVGSYSPRPMSLSDLKKQRIDVEDELEKLQDRMAKIDEQIAKLQSAHPAKESRLEPQAR